MTPSNQPNGNPLIYRICDALGVFHLVAPANHTHAQSEIDGLQAALLNKADANRTETELNKKIEKVLNATSGDIAVFDIDGAVEDSGIKVSDLQLKLTFDINPTTNSTNPVTSGGVKEAIDNAIAIRYYPAQSTAKPSIEDIFDDENLQKVDCGILNSTGSEASITDLFSISVGQTLILPDNAPTIPNGKMVLLHIYRAPAQGQFMISIGGIYTIS